MLPAQPFATSPGVVRAARSEQEIVSNRVEGVGAACQSHQEKSGEKLKGKTALSRIIFSCSSTSSKHWEVPVPLCETPPGDRGTPRAIPRALQEPRVGVQGGRNRKGTPAKRVKKITPNATCCFFPKRGNIEGFCHPPAPSPLQFHTTCFTVQTSNPACFKPRSTQGLSKQL